MNIFLTSLVTLPFWRGLRRHGRRSHMNIAPTSLATLSRLPAGQRAVIHALRGGHEFCSRVANLGFTEGAPVQVQQNYGHGPILVSVRGALVALGRAEADKIVVQVGEA